MERLGRRWAAATTGGRTPKWLPDEILVRFKSGLSPAQIHELTQLWGTQVRKRLVVSGIYRLEVGEHQDLQATLARVAADPRVELADVNGVGRFSFGAGDPYFPFQLGLHDPDNPTNSATIQALPAWAIHRGEEPIVVAVIDSGIDATHPDLKNRLWTNAGEIPGDGVDNDANGYVDDVLGWSFQAEGAGSPDVSDTEGHGTRVAGIIAAEPDNGVGIRGVMANARIMTLKVEYDATGNLTAGEAAEAICYAAHNGAEVINMSFNFYGSSPRVVQMALDAAYARGCVLVAASGNQDAPIDSLPALSANVLCVGASLPDGRRATTVEWGTEKGTPLGSSYGPQIDVVAPGHEIFGTRIQSGTPLPWDRDSGTSLSAAFVSGVAALILSHNPGLRRNPEAVYARIRSTAIDIEYARHYRRGDQQVIETVGPGRDDSTGHGIVNAYRALSAASVNILTPTTGFTHYSSEDHVFLGGITTGPGIRSVRWENTTTGQSGFMDSLSAWRARVPLTFRVNRITVTADAQDGSSVSDELAVILMQQGPFRIVSLTGDPSPDGRGSFSGFGLPSLNTAGQTAFRAGLADRPNGRRGGVFMFTPESGAMRHLAMEADLAPDCESKIDLLWGADAGDVALHDTGLAWFTAMLTDTTNGSADDSAVFRYSPDSNSLTIALREGSVSGRHQVGHIPFRLNPSINGPGQLAVIAPLRVDGDSRMEVQSVYGVEATGRILTLAKEGDRVPGTPGIIHAFSPSAGINDKGQVVFVAALAGTPEGVYDREAIYRHDSNGLTEIARTRSSGGLWQIFPLWGVPMNDDGVVAFRGRFYEDLSLVDAVFLGSGSSPVEVARAGRMLPGRDRSLYSIRPHLDLNNRAQVAFLAQLSGEPANSPPTALLRGDPITLAVVAAKGDRLRGIFSPIEDFHGTKFAMNDAGQIAFLANLSSQQRVLAMHDDGLGLLKIAATGEPFLGGTIESLNIHGTSEDDVGRDGRSSLESGGSVAFRFTLEDGRHGVAVWESPRIRASTPSVRGRDVLLSWSAWAGRRYRVQAASTLGEDFLNISAEITPEGEGRITLEYTDVDGAGRSPTRFYRLQLLP